MSLSYKSVIAISGFVICMSLSGIAFPDGKADEKAGELAGEWTLTIDTPRGVQHPTLVVHKDGDRYSGVYNSRRGPIEIEAIDTDGKSFNFPLVISIPIGDIEVIYAGSFRDNDMTGSVQSPRGEVPFTGKRTDARRTDVGRDG